MSNPLGPDGYPLENHHVGRLDQDPGEVNLITRTEHQLIHQDEIDAVREVFIKDGLRGNPNAWTGKVDQR